jgi:hypothetical protein
MFLVTTTARAQTMERMTVREASDYLAKVINPILESGAHETLEIAGLRSRILQFLQMVNAGDLLYIARTTPSPQPELHVLAKTEITPTSAARLILFLPDIRKWQGELAAEEFHYGVLLLFAHEMIHVEVGDQYPENTDESVAKEEAAVWGKTVLEIIRPLLLARKPVPPNHILLSEALKTFQDQPTNSGWIQIFKLKPTVSPTR